MGARELVEKIRADAEAEAGRIRAECEEELARIEHRRRRETERLEKEYSERTVRDTRLIVERAKSRARVAARNRALAAKWTGIDRVMKLAAERVVEDKEYLKLLRGLADRLAGRGSVIRLSAQDTARLARNGKLKPGEPADISGGLIVEQGRMSLDLSTDRALAALKDALARRLSEILFPEEDRVG